MIMRHKGSTPCAHPGPAHWLRSPGYAHRSTGPAHAKLIKRTGRHYTVRSSTDEVQPRSTHTCSWEKQQTPVTLWHALTEVLGKLVHLNPDERGNCLVRWPHMAVCGVLLWGWGSLQVK